MSERPAVNLGDPAVVVDLLGRAAEANLACPLRRGSAVRLPPQGRVVMTGDLHDHALNARRVLQLAALPDSPGHHLILHEVIHGPHRINGRDLSARLLLQTANLKLRFPGQVHVIQSNHELAQVRGEDILKAGGSVITAFNNGLDFMFGDGAEDVAKAIAAYVRSLPLAVVCPRGILCSHSLPSMRFLETFDATILDRIPTDQDLSPAGPAHQMVWGRTHREELAQRLATAWGVRLFVLGHQPAEMGFELEGESMLVIASNDEHGMALPIDLARDYTRDALVEALIPLAGVSLEQGRYEL